MNKKWWIVTGVVGLVAALGLAGYLYLVPQQSMAEEPTETAVVRRGALLVTVEGTGSLAPRSEVSLSFPSSSGGRVAEVFVEEGQQVEAGQPLARLETDDLELQVAQAEVSLAQAQVQLTQTQAGSNAEDIAAQEASLRNAQANLAGLLAGPSETEIEIARIGVDQAKDNLYGVQAQRDAVKGSPQAQPGEEASAEASVLQAEDAVRIAEQRYEETIAGPSDEDVAAARAQVDQAQAQLDKLKNSPTPEEVELARLQVEQALASLDQARLRLEQATLTALMAGTITALNAQPGEMASAGQSVVVLSDLTVLEVDVNLDETDVVRVAVGQEAQVSLDAFPSVEMAGEVTYIAPVAETQSGVVLYPVTIRLTPGDPSTGSGQGLPVRAGMTSDVEITTASQEDALIVPLRAIETEGERAYVRRVAGDQTERVTVELGMVTETEVEITGDGAEGPALSLVEGDVVLVVPSAQGSAGGGPFGMFGAGE